MVPLTLLDGEDHAPVRRALLVLGLGAAGDDELVVAALDAEPAAAVGPFALRQIELAVALGTLLGHGVRVAHRTKFDIVQEIGRQRTN